MYTHAYPSRPMPRTHHYPVQNPLEVGPSGGAVVGVLTARLGAGLLEHLIVPRSSVSAPPFLLRSEEEKLTEEEADARAIAQAAFVAEQERLRSTEAWKFWLAGGLKVLASAGGAAIGAARQAAPLDKGRSASWAAALSGATALLSMLGNAKMDGEPESAWLGLVGAAAGARLGER